MSENMSSETGKTTESEIYEDFYPLVRRYKDGRIERFFNSFVPASNDPAANRGVATRDVVIDQGTGVSARLFLPSQAVRSRTSRLPLVIYFHGGAFVTDSAFSRTYNRYVSSLAASSGALVVSVEYRLAPEHPIPRAYDDACGALRWVASLADPWLVDYADRQHTFLAGDSAGGNIVYNTAVRATQDDECMMDIEGLIMVHPFFWGVERLPSEESCDGAVVFPPLWVDELWPFVTAGKAGNDDPHIDPRDDEIASITCRRVLVAVAEKDSLRERGCRFASRMRSYARVHGNVTLLESKGEDHGFHLYRPLSATSKELMKSIVQFINQPSTSPSSPTNVPDAYQGGLCWTQPILGVPTTPFKDIMGYGMRMKHWDDERSVTRNALKIGRLKVSRISYGLSLNRSALLPAIIPGSNVLKNFFF